MKNFWRGLKKPIIVLAPMAGITDSAFRLLCREYGADVVYTEMVSAESLVQGNKKTCAMLKFKSVEKPVVVQIFGKKPTSFFSAAKIVEKFGVQGVDINFGCPARKVMAGGGGVTLFKDLKLCQKIIAETIRAVKIPVSVKVRASIGTLAKENKITALDFVEVIDDLGVSALMIHGRSYEQGFSGTVNYGLIKEVKRKFSGIVLANGGIMKPKDAKKMLEKTGADGVGIARGAQGRPWIFKQVKDYLATGKYEELDFTEIKKVALKQAQIVAQEKGALGLVELRKHLAWYVKGFAGASQIRKKLVRVNDFRTIEKIFKKIG